MSSHETESRSDSASSVTAEDPAGEECVGVVTSRAWDVVGVVASIGELTCLVIFLGGEGDFSGIGFLVLVPGTLCSGESIFCVL